MWDVETARALHVGKGHAGSIKSVATRAETTHLIATGGRDGHIMLVTCAATRPTLRM